MARIIILQHSPYEPLGIIVNTLRRMKMRLRYINFHRNPDQRVDLDGYDGLVILGGNMNPDELARYPHLVHEIQLIEEAMKRGLPVLGICLGSQLLNLALGGSCYRLDTPEFGWSTVNKVNEQQLFSAFSQQSQVFQWHQYASTPAKSCDVILENNQCAQAFCSEGRYIGLQFHLEVDAPLVNRWLRHPDYLTHLKAHMETDEILTMQKDTERALAESMRIGTHFFEQFCLLFESKKQTLPSMHAGK